jgi:hypothetical protein
MGVVHNQMSREINAVKITAYGALRKRTIIRIICFDKFSFHLEQKSVYVWQNRRTFWTAEVILWHGTGVGFDKYPINHLAIQGCHGSHSLYGSDLLVFNGKMRMWRYLDYGLVVHFDWESVFFSKYKPKVRDRQPCLNIRVVRFCITY